MWQYIKTAHSKQYFVAGYWGILFHGVETSSSKVKDTTGLYKLVFKNESDMYPAKRKGKK